MVARSGEGLEIYIGDGGSPQAFSHVGGARLISMQLQNQLREAPYAGDEGWQMLADIPAQRGVRLKAEGVFLDTGAEELLRACAFAEGGAMFRILFANGALMEGKFAVSSYTRRGDVEAHEAYAVELFSSGQVSYEMPDWPYAVHMDAHRVAKIEQVMGPDIFAIADALALGRLKMEDMARLLQCCGQPEKTAEEWQEILCGCGIVPAAEALAAGFLKLLYGVVDELPTKLF